MGFAALKLDHAGFDEEAGSVIRLTPANTDLPPGPAAPKADLQRLLAIISKVAGLLNKQRDRADSYEKRCAAAEDLAKDAARRVTDLEGRLKAALDEAGAERRRFADLQKRSAEIVDKSRAMLCEASERIRNAETRANRAESHFATVRDALERQFGGEAA